jgi:hypothetical protein
MKYKIITILSLMVLFGTISCTKKSINYSQSFDYARSGKVIFLGNSKGLVTVSSEQTAESLSKAISFAEVNALENLLFKGVSSSPQENPMISDEVLAQKESPMVLKGLIFENGYKVFLTESQILQSFKDKGEVTVVQKVTFDIPALRKFLEKNEVIKKFGF